MPELPNAHALATLFLTIAALFVFSREKWLLEISSLAVLVVLAVGFALFPFPGFDPTSLFYGFAHEALIAVCALMVLGQGLVRTGALEPVGRMLASLWQRAPFLSLFITLVIAAVLSAFVNNTPIVVLLLPILISVCLRNKTSASRILMPMGFATLVGGMATTIGTSTNLLVVSVAADLGLEKFNLFDAAHRERRGGLDQRADELDQLLDQGRPLCGGGIEGEAVEVLGDLDLADEVLADAVEQGPAFGARGAPGLDVGQISWSPVCPPVGLPGADSEERAWARISSA